MFRSLIVVFLFLGLSSASFAIDKKYFEIKKVTIQEVTDEQPSGLLAQTYGVASDCSSLPASPSSSFILNGNFSPSAIDTSGVDQIINGEFHAGLTCRVGHDRFIRPFWFSMKMPMA